MEQLATSEREKKAAEDSREKASNQVLSLQDSQKKLRDKNERLDSALLSAQERIRELEYELDKHSAESEIKSYNITVVENEPVLESAPNLFADDGLFKTENETLKQVIKELTSKVEQVQGEKKGLSY